MVLFVTFLSACAQSPSAGSSSEDPKSDEAELEAGSGAEQEDSAVDPEADAEAGSENRELKLVSLGKIKHGEAYLVYLYANPDSYQGLALAQFADDSVLEFGKLYRAQTDGIMTRSIPPQLGATDAEVLEARPAALDLEFSDLVLIKSFSSDFQLIDVRTPAEYESGHIKGASLLPLQEIQNGERGDLQKDLPIFLYCRSGNRSGQALEILAEDGYPLLANLGGIKDYHGDLSQD
ncbi:MAG: rhodanese-like domain-containing protein [Eubacteriales bacterium]|nr:rhodanese-like domain-containing protein [Eubacteriales bacterium]